MLWAVLGAGAGLLASIALSEWVGEVNSGRVRRIAERLREQGRTRMTAAASARAVQVALNAEPRLAGLPIEARAVSRGAVELRGWVPSRSMTDRRRPHGPRRPRHRECDQQPAGARRGRSPLARPAPGGRPERMTAPLAPQYDPSEIESQLYAWWRERDLFSPEEPRGPVAARRVSPTSSRCPRRTSRRSSTPVTVSTTRSRTSSSASSGCEAAARSGCRAPTTPASRPRTWWSGSSPRRDSPGSTSGARPSWSGSGPTWGRPAPGFCSSSRRSAAPPTGRARTSRSTRISRGRCARSSSGSTRRGSSTAAITSSTGAPAA